MAQFQDLDLEGGKELDRMLRRLPHAVAVKHLKVAASEALEPIREGARQNLRSTSRQRTGDLQRGLKIRVTIAAGDVLAQLFTTRDVFYGRFLEFGTRYIRGRRWMSRAIAARQSDALRVFSAQLWRDVVAEVRRLRR